MASSAERQRLLSLVADLVIDNGLHDLSLSGIARSIGSNNRMLLYYFQSRDRLLEEALQVVQARFPKIAAIFDHLRGDEDLQLRLYRAWEEISDVDNSQLLQVFFQWIGRALYDREQNAAFLRDVASTWITSLTAIFEAEGCTPHIARLTATHIVALWRGLQVALVSGDDPQILGEAYRRAIRTLLIDLKAGS